MSGPSRREVLQLLAIAGAGCSTESRVVSRGEAIVDVAPLVQPWQTLDPFLFCVHHDDRYPAGNAVMGPAASLEGRERGRDFAGKDGWRMYHGERVPGFPQHPHRGFETVTVVRRGLLDHADSLGAAARYGEGDVQWLTAGGGILHAEMFPLLDAARPNPVELFQIWLNLPRRDKLVDPHFSMLWAQTIPRYREPGVDVAVVAGGFAGLTTPSPPPHSWAAVAGNDVAIWTIRLAPGARWQLPVAQRGSHRMLYFFAGTRLEVDARVIPPASAVQLRADSGAVLVAGDGVELLMLQGRPIGEPVVQHGPFVMNTRDEIRATIADYQRTQFGGWRWPTREPVHPRDQGRFARFADGRLDQPA